MATSKKNRKPVRTRAPRTTELPAEERAALARSAWEKIAKKYNVELVGQATINNHMFKVDVFFAATQDERLVE